MHQTQHILISAAGLFLKLGIRSVSMDDVARAVGISKKTLYQHVENKSDLVTQVLRSHLEEIEARVRSIRSGTTGNAIDEMIAICQSVVVDMRTMHPSTLHDLKKYYPESWRLLEQHKNEFVYGVVQANLQRGIDEGLYRTEIDRDIIARIYMNTIDDIVDLVQFPSTEYDFEKVYLEYIRYHLNGIATPEGARVLQTRKLRPE